MTVTSSHVLGPRTALFIKKGLTPGSHGKGDEHCGTLHVAVIVVTLLLVVVTFALTVQCLLLDVDMEEMLKKKLK